MRTSQKYPWALGYVGARIPQRQRVFLVMLALLCSHLGTGWRVRTAAAAMAPPAAVPASHATQRASLARAPRVALVIGNNAYEKALKNAVQDAQDITEKLRGLGFRVTQRTDVDRKSMRQAIRDFGAALTPHSVGVFYFAGHGVQSTGGKNYLLPVGVSIASEADVEDEGVDVDLVLRELGQARNPLNLLILDTCRTNPFLGEYLARQQGLARMEGPVGTLIAYATTPGTWAADGEGRNGIYTKHLLTAMTVPGLTLERMFKQVRNAVREETQGRQVPWESSALTEEFAFVEASAPPPVRPARLPTASLTVRSTVRKDHVMINGQNHGPTPVARAVEPGSYTIEVHTAGHPPWTETVQLTPGEQRVVRAVFTKSATNAAGLPRPVRLPVAHQPVPRRVASAGQPAIAPRQRTAASVITDIPSTIFRTGQRLVGSGLTQVRRTWNKIFD